MMMLLRASLLLAVASAQADSSVHPMSSHSEHPQEPARTTSTAAAAPAALRKTDNGLPALPTVRFTAWDHLSHENHDRAKAFGYHEKDWNKPGQFPAEKLDYESLASGQQKQLDAMGVAQAQWDCYVNHYRNYDWDELEEVQQQHYVRLGWSEDKWESEDETDIEGKYWEDLTTVQQVAASGLCYTQELWDEVAIPLWSKDNGQGGETGEPNAQDLYSAKETQVADEKQDIYENLYDANDRDKQPFDGPASAHNSRKIEVPFFRYDPWDLLQPDLKKYATKAGYDEKTWNDIGSHPMERQDFETIGKKQPKVQKALKALGFRHGSQWDCYISHYQSYEWNELVKYGVVQFVQELGYNHKSWDESAKPETDGMYWPDLTPAQQNAAYELGYFREVWDEVSLQFWPRTTSNTKSLKKFAKHHPAAVGGGVVLTLTVLVGLVFGMACWIRRQQRQNSSDLYPKDLEMYPPGFPSSYKDDPNIDGAVISYADDYDNEEVNNTQPIA